MMKYASRKYASFKLLRLAVVISLFINQGAAQGQEKFTFSTPIIVLQKTRCHAFKARLYVLATRSHGIDKEASEQITHLLCTCNDSQLLYTAALWSIKQRKAHHHDGQCPICDRYEDIQDLSLLRLAGLHSPEACRYLVSLLEANFDHWDGHSAETIALAITRAGKPTLPYLERLHHKSHLLHTILTAVKAGTVLQ